MRILLRAAALADERTPQIAATVSAENGKTITEATMEAGRSGDLIWLSAFEGTQLYTGRARCRGPQAGAAREQGRAGEAPRGLAAARAEVRPRLRRRVLAAHRPGAQITIIEYNSMTGRGGEQ
jgi:acyl-CoA reductase-like NAD-dependent aldehyde dehydrogenase